MAAYCIPAQIELRAHEADARPRPRRPAAPARGRSGARCGRSRAGGPPRAGRGRRPGAVRRSSSASTSSGASPRARAALVGGRQHLADLVVALAQPGRASEGREPARRSRVVADRQPAAADLVVQPPRPTSGDHGRQARRGSPRRRSRSRRRPASADCTFSRMWRAAAPGHGGHRRPGPGGPAARTSRRASGGSTRCVVQRRRDRRPRPLDRRCRGWKPRWRTAATVGTLSGVR